MANLTPAPSWDDVPQLEESTIALGGPDGPMNGQAKALAARTELLRIDLHEALGRIYEERGWHLRPHPESFGNGGTLTSAADVLLDWANFRAYSGPGPYPQTVAPNTNPSSGGFVDRSATNPGISLPVGNVAASTAPVGAEITTLKMERSFQYSVIPNTATLGDGDILIDRADGTQALISVDDAIDVKAFYRPGRTDQQVLQAAFDYAGTVAGYCEVKITAKNKAGDPWVFTGLQIKSKTVVTGCGGWLKLADNVCVNAGTSYYPVHNMGADDVHIRNLLIDGNQANNTLYTVADILTFGGARSTLKNVQLVNAPDSCLMYATATDSVIDNLLVDNCRDVGIYCNAGTPGGTRNCIINNVVAKNCAHGAIAFKRYVADILASNIVAQLCGNGITFEGFEVVTPGMNPSNISISGVRMRDIGYPYRANGAAERGFSFSHARNIRITDVSIFNCSGVGLYFSQPDPSIGIYINGVSMTGFSSNPQIVAGAPSNHGLSVGGVSGFELNNINIEGFAGYAARFFGSSAGSVIGGRWGNVQASGYSAFNGARVDAGNAFTKFMPEFISGASGTDLEWFAGATGITKDTILNNATGPAKYGYVTLGVGQATPVGFYTPRFIGQEVWLPGTSKWWKSHGLTNADWTQLTN